MRSVEIAGTEITTSRLGMGTANLHHLVRRSARQNLLSVALDAGIRYFDTAPLYGHEMAERELGLFFRGRRHSAAIATKIGILPRSLFSAAPFLMYAQKASLAMARRLSLRVAKSAAPARDYSREYAVLRVETSLRNLATDYIDVLFLHEPQLDDIQSADDLIDTLEKLRASGKIREFGVSGTFESCSAINARYPALTAVVQMEVDRSMQHAQFGSAPIRAAQITFGHVRNMRIESTASNEESSFFRRAMAQACKVNPSGVILLSTRNPAHARDAVAAIESIES